MNDITLLREAGPERPAAARPPCGHAARAALLDEIDRSATARGRFRARLPSRKAGAPDRRRRSPSPRSPGPPPW